MLFVEGDGAGFLAVEVDARHIGEGFFFEVHFLGLTGRFGFGGRSSNLKTVVKKTS